jgi:hypothetical protein
MTEKKIEISRLNALLIIIATVAACVIILSIILHIKLVELEHDLEDFASHHYFLAGFIALIIMLTCMRLYNDTPTKVSSFNIFKKKTRDKRLLRKIERIDEYKKHIRGDIENEKSKFIEKENVASLTFPEEDVLLTKDELSNREHELNSALKLGNNYKHKVKIYFKDSECNKHIETTVWHLDKINLTIKGGVTIPIRSVYKVDI